MTPKLNPFIVGSCLVLTGFFLCHDSIYGYLQGLCGVVLVSLGALNLIKK